MIEIDITSDIDQMLRGAEQFAARIEGVAAQALNTVAFNVRSEIINVTYPKAFTVRNRALARRLWKVKLAKKADLHAAVEQTLDREWTAIQAEGGAKPHRGAQIAIPTNPDAVRTATGRVRSVMKPLNITKRKDTFLMGKGASKKAIVRRDRKTKELTTIYTFQSGARIPKRFMFYEDATKEAIAEFPRQMRLHMNVLIARSVFSGSV